jgi:hypothetical protein
MSRARLARRADAAPPSNVEPALPPRLRTRRDSALYLGISLAHTPEPRAFRRRL